MLELHDISVQASDNPDSPYLLQGVSLCYPPGHFGAIVGPSGCGKSTLLKTIVGLYEPSEGAVHWEESNLSEEEDLHPSELGYVPQFSICHEKLTVQESVINAVRLRVPAKSLTGTVHNWANHILEQVGLLEISDRKAYVLSGGQRRRLGLALELVSNPALLLCDEVTSGLDPKSEDEIVQLMRTLANQDNRTVLSVTHSLRHLDLYDSVTVLYRGKLAYQGPPKFLLDYFSAAYPEDVFPHLTQAEPEAWAEHWIEHRESLGISPPPKQAESNDEEPAEIEAETETQPAPTNPTHEKEKKELPGFFTQFRVLFLRRWKLFFRDKSQVLLQLSLLLIFPGLVAIFAYKGLPAIQNMSMDNDADIISALKERLEFHVQMSRVGGLVSGLVMFQVILLTLMGSNNSAREIASERQIFEKEKLAGVRVGSYLTAKILFLSALVMAQALWMTFFVKEIGTIPGSFASQGLMFFLVTAAMTMTCLAISAWSRTAEQASLISIYLVGFQLPLSGAVLALPEFLGILVRPFIVAYWSWSGYLLTMQHTRFYDLVLAITTTPLKDSWLCGWVLTSHILVALILAILGCARSQWE